MKSIKKIVLMMVVTTAALLLTSCGDDKKDSPILYQTNPNGYMNSFQGNPCNQMISNYGYQGYNNTFSFNGSYPNMGYFLQNNPNAIFQNNGQCFNGTQLYDMYVQTGMPWAQFAYSPFGQFQYYQGGGYPYQPSTSSWNVSSSNAYNASGNFVGAGDVFGGGYPFTPLGRNRWGLSINYRSR